jgi:hypothetical protein
LPRIGFLARTEIKKQNQNGPKLALAVSFDWANWIFEVRQELITVETAVLAFPGDSDSDSDYTVQM